MNPLPKSIVFVQYAGDYAEAWRRLDGGGSENYYAQKYSLEVVAGLVSSETRVAVICCTADRDEDVVLPNGVRVINMRSPDGVDARRVNEAVRICEPTHVCLRTPMHAVLRSVIRMRSVQSVLLTLADSFEAKDLRSRLRAWRLGRLLNRPEVLAVGNHGLNASNSLKRIGVSASKIIPWDWPHSVTPHQETARTAVGAAPWRLFFVGLIVESKGVGDLIRAVSLLKDDGIEVMLDCAGRGDVDRFAALAMELGVSAQVRFLGSIPHTRVVPSMKEADLVVIPSRHDYPEGFPMTIYEALSSRTPIVASDHPMFAPHLLRTGAASVFAASDPSSLARSVKALLLDSNAYANVSTASARAWDELQLPVTWGDLITAWIEHGSDGQYAPLQYALSSRQVEKGL